MWKLEDTGGVKGLMINWMDDTTEMRIVIKNEKSVQREVISGMPQGLVLTPLKFLICEMTCQRN